MDDSAVGGRNRVGTGGPAEVKWAGSRGAGMLVNRRGSLERIVIVPLYSTVARLAERTSGSGDGGDGGSRLTVGVMGFGIIIFVGADILRSRFLSDEWRPVLGVSSPNVVVLVEADGLGGRGMVGAGGAGPNRMCTLVVDGRS